MKFIKQKTVNKTTATINEAKISQIAENCMKIEIVLGSIRYL